MRKINPKNLVSFMGFLLFLLFLLVFISFLVFTPLVQAVLPKYTIIGTKLDVEANVGVMYFAGELAEFYILVSLSGNPIDVDLRELERRRLFAHEEVVANVLSTVRLKFLTILLRKEQLAKRLMAGQPGT